MNLTAHYTALWEQAAPRLRANQLSLDALLDDPADTRRGLTLIARPQPAVQEAIGQVLGELRLLEPAQYYYPAADLHLTVLTLLSAVPDFLLSPADRRAYVAVLRAALRAAGPCAVQLRGLTASDGAVLVQGFPTDEGLESLRAQVRAAVRASGLPQSMDRRYVLRTAHCTVLRFRAPLQQPAAFVQALARFRHHDFGLSRLTELELVDNDWYHRSATEQVLARLPLS